MNYNYSKLRGRIVEYYGKQSNFAKSLGISSVSLNKKLNNRVKFTQDEIYLITQKLNINYTEVYDYFFTLKVDK